MLYQFPSPEWFVPGTTSHLVVKVALLVIIIGLPGSIFACWGLPLRSRVAWGFAMAFWGAAFLSVWILFANGVLPLVFRDQPVAACLAASVIMAVVPLPALVAGWQELVGIRGRVFGFTDIPPWGCAIPIAIILFAIPALALTVGPRLEYVRMRLCLNHLQMIGLSLYDFHDKHGAMPDSQIQTAELPVRSWRVEILPFMERKDVYEAYDQKSAWDDLPNWRLAKQDLDGMYVCNSVPETARHDESRRWYSAYALLTGPDTAFPNGKGQPSNAIKDGTSNTVLMVEACGRQIVWTAPKDVEATSTNIGINLPGSQPGQSSGTWSSYHRGSANTMLMDGSVRTLSVHTDPRVLRAITTANGGEPDVLE
ncbi:MAG: hypothetical protein JWN70_5419 [Planctomycetaceae bacterium]|nr:hypothetical protein [Planctomycetaceae bacterium]